MSRISSQDYEELRRRQQGRNYDMAPKSGPSASQERRQWKQIRDQLQEALRQWALEQW
jgi:hypothetical protein